MKTIIQTRIIGLIKMKIKIQIKTIKEIQSYITNYRLRWKT